MAEITVSNDTSFVKENNPIHIEFLHENTPVVRSDDLAAHFNRSHKNVLRDIAKLRPKCPESFYGLNFEPVEYVDSKGEKRRAYLLTRDAFSLLVMGFTGAAAVAWKLRYIEAFNALEAVVQDNIRTDAVEYGRQLAIEEARALPAIEADRKQAYLDGMAEGGKLAEKRDGLNLLLRAKAYIDKGLNKTEAATLCGVNRRSLHRLIVKSRRVGL